MPSPGSLPAAACLSDRVCEESTKVTSEDIASGLAARAEAFFDESPKGMVGMVVRRLWQFVTVFPVKEDVVSWIDYGCGIWSRIV